MARNTSIAAIKTATTLILSVLILLVFIYRARWFFIRGEVGDFGQPVLMILSNLPMPEDSENII